MTKAELRGRARQLLREMPAAERAAAEAEIAVRVWTVPEVAAARRLLLFADLPEEVPTNAIAVEAWRRGLDVIYPRIVAETRALSLHSVESLERLEPGEYGIRQPDRACERVNVGEIDAVLVPGLAWDRAGQRLGRGAGYYDRLFAAPEWRGFRCGVFFAAQEAPGGIPPDPWDVRLDAVVTEREVWRAV